jgi:hypothetical protein
MVNGSLVTAKKLQSNLSVEDVSAERLFQAGENCFYGWSVPQSYETAARFYHYAASQGHPDAACNFGCMLTLGLGVDKDAAESLLWFDEAARQDHPVGWFNLSHHSEYGIGTARDGREAYFLDWSGKKRNSPEYSAKDTDDTDDCSHWIPFVTERTSKFVTFYEPPLPVPSEDEHWPTLRKVRLEQISSSRLAGRVLVLRGGDYGLTCGDLLDRLAFYRVGHYICELGGMPPEGLTFGPVQDESVLTMGMERTIVGEIRGERINLNWNACDALITHRIIGSLFKRGLGVRQNEEEAAKYLNWNYPSDPLHFTGFDSCGNPIS